MGREIYDIINDMAEVLNASQMQKLQEVLVKRLSENTVSDYLQTTNMNFLDMFLTTKHLERCSDKTIRYYRCNIEKMLDTINIPVIKITTEMLRKYLVEYQTINNCGKVTIDNIRRSLSTFFSWLEEEDYIIETNYPAFTVPRGLECRNNREINDTHINLTTSIYCSKLSSITSPVESKRTELRALR